jgi:hypothetical protein
MQRKISGSTRVLPDINGSDLSEAQMESDLLIGVELRDLGAFNTEAGH